VQGPHDRHHHHPAGLIRLAVLGGLALLLAAPAHGSRFAPLPSPTAPLSPQPPLGPATTSREGVRHHVDASTRVDVSVDAAGDPFAVVATQRLAVRVKGDYLFTVGAPVEDVEAAPGSASTPGFRTGAIVWAGFDPGRRLLAARATLDRHAVAPLLPLRIVVAGSRTTLVNATRTTVGAFGADAVPASALRALRDIRLGRAAGALVNGTPVPARIAVAAPLRVTGTIGSRRVALVLRDRVTIAAAGAVRLTVTPLRPAVPVRLPRSGRELFALASRLALATARAGQYQRFLANPDTQGRSETAFVYRTARRPVVAAPAVVVVHHGRSWVEAALVAIGLVALAAAALAAWARA
jgi:hypothetical protein